MPPHGGNLTGGNFPRRGLLQSQGHLTWRRGIDWPSLPHAVWQTRFQSHAGCSVPRGRSWPCRGGIVVFNRPFQPSVPGPSRTGGRNRPLIASSAPLVEHPASGGLEREHRSKSFAALGSTAYIGNVRGEPSAATDKRLRQQQPTAGRWPAIRLNVTTNRCTMEIGRRQWNNRLASTGTDSLVRPSPWRGERCGRSDRPAICDHPLFPG